MAAQARLLLFLARLLLTLAEAVAERAVMRQSPQQAVLVAGVTATY